MPESKPLYIVYVCPNCVAIRHFKRKDDNSNVYRCHVCGFEVSYDNGVITTIGISSKGFSKPKEESMRSVRKKIRDYYPKGLVRNPYGRRGLPK